MTGMKLEVLKERKTALPKAVWKKLLSGWVKTYQLIRTLRDTDHLEEVLLATSCMKEWCLVLDKAFLKEFHQGIVKQLDKFIEPLQEAVIQQSFFELFSELSKKGKRNELKQKIDHILSELQTNRDLQMRKTLKLVGEFNARRAAAALFSDFNPDNFSDTVAFGKYLDGERDKLFNRLVEVIRSGRREDLGGLRMEVEKFCYDLQIAVASGFEKGKKLLQVLRNLGSCLSSAQNEERFRWFVQGLEEDRYSDQEKVADVIWLREIRNHLGLKQAQTLQDFHAQIPPSLQVLKRRLVWK